MKNLNYFFGAVKNSILYIISCIVLVVLACFLLISFNTGEKDKSSELVAFFVGIVSSVIATAFFKIFDNYSLNVIAHHKIIEKTNIFIFKVKQWEIQPENFDKESLFELYINICSISNQLTYYKDFRKISAILYDIVCTYNNGTKLDSIYHKLRKLEYELQRF